MTTAKRLAADFEDGLAPSRREQEQMDQALSTWGTQLRSISPQIRKDASAAVVRGKWIFYWPPVLRQLGRAGRFEDAYELAMECVVVAERALRRDGHPPPPAWTRFAAVYARKLGRLDLEMEVLAHYLEVAGPDSDSRLIERKALVERRIQRVDDLKPKRRPDPMF